MKKETIAKQDGQQILFEANYFQKWKDEWKGMPEFLQDDITPYKSITIHFANRDDIKSFEKLIGYSINSGGGIATGKSIWYPPQKIGKIAGRFYISELKDES